MTRDRMTAVVHSSSASLLKLQGLMAIFLCALSQEILTALGLSLRWTPMVIFQLLSGIGQFFLLAMILLLLYLDQRRLTIMVAAVFALTNLLGSTLCVQLGPDWYGAGYLVATIIGACFGWYTLSNRLGQLEYLTFMSQPFT
jgi:polysaccharide biosynthesis protein PelG